MIDFTVAKKYEGHANRDAIFSGIQTLGTAAQQFVTATKRIEDDMREARERMARGAALAWGSFVLNPQQAFDVEKYSTQVNAAITLLTALGVDEADIMAMYQAAAK